MTVKECMEKLKYEAPTPLPALTDETVKVTCFREIDFLSIKNSPAECSAQRFVAN